MKKLFLALITIFVLLLTSCGEDITKIEVNSLADYYFVEDFELKDINLEVTPEKGQVYSVVLDKKMISEDDFNKLLEPGSNEITVNYKGKSTKFTILLVDGKVKYKVKYIDHNDTVLLETDVKYGTKVIVPVLERYGYKFVKWDKSSDFVTENMTIKPIFEILKNELYFIINSTNKTIEFKFAGDISIAGFEIELTYDKDVLEVTSIVEMSGVVYNSNNPGKIILNYASAENINKEDTIIKINYNLLKNSSINIKANVKSAKVIEGTTIKDTTINIHKNLK